MSAVGVPVTPREISTAEVAVRQRSGWAIMAAFAVVALVSSPVAAGESSATDDAIWVRPSGGAEETPVWGHRDGLRVGIAPLPGPRGLLRVYAPYLGDRDRHVINYIAIEPVPQGQEARGLSELEFSELDQQRGKRFWSVNDPVDATPRDDAAPATGVVNQVDGVSHLQVFIQVERFLNGAHVYARLTFREDQPHAVGVALFAHEDSRPLSKCIATATMGNYARVRELHLAERVVEAGGLWPDYRGDGFTPHARFPLQELKRTANGAALASVTPDEASPQDAPLAPGTRGHWRYQGLRARQSWRVADPAAELEVLVNGRFAYWASQAPIPGGIAFENFEMVSPFRQGEEFCFSVDPLDETPTQAAPTTP
ncbi:hypothetical protein [Botrimarina mediterranea]|uniref:hypothetical protein n=1 Tax=Botrimarina mediterranea TaxID=2528022 RepID=UPI0018D2B57D|nr:hypothetical protein [Botrimarina mediterranea]